MGVDIVGRPLWIIPPSDAEARVNFVESVKAELKKLKETDFEKIPEGAVLKLPMVNIPSATPGTPEEEVEKGVVVLESMISATEEGGEGQSILMATFHGETLHGICMSPERNLGFRISHRIKDLSYGSEESFRSDLISGVLQEWSDDQNAVIAWDAVRVLCGDLVPSDIFPKEPEA
tara:strand:+ start:413 stop:940 length:528 start_codon:yes stop_codon:yes gene_type:complete